MFRSSSAIRIAFAAATLAAAAVSLDACAAGGGSRADRVAAKMKERFSAADTDHDGFISRTEADSGMPRIAQHFDQVDANHDGKLSPDEIAAYVREMRASR